MFYFKELSFRCMYILSLFICIFLISSSYNNVILNIFVSPILKQFNNNTTIFESSFICNSPMQMLDANFALCLIFSFILIVPFILMQLFSFFCSGFYILEYRKIKKKLYFFILIFYFINFFELFIVLPYLWYFIELINQYVLMYLELNLEYEPNLLQYLKFVYTSNIFFNLLYILCYIIFVFLQNKGLEYYVINRKFLNSVVCFIIITISTLFIEITFLIIPICIIFFVVIITIKKITSIFSIFFFKKALHNYILKNYENKITN